MLHLSTILAILAATSVNSLPLNINLGAYSPALVVGDGEISFGGETDVTNLMTALSGASETAAGTATTGSTNTGAAKEITKAQQDDTPAEVVAVTPTPSAAAVPSTLGLQGMGKAIRPRLSTSTSATETESETESDADSDEIVEVKEIEPRSDDTEIEARAEDVAATAEKQKRDLAGFNAALNYAAAALKTSPEIQLGTGEGGSGVGITVKGGSAVGKREIKSSGFPTVTMLKIRTIGDKTGNAAKRSETLRVRDLPTVARSVPAAADDDIDQVNVNLGDAQDYELTITEVKP